MTATGHAVIGAVIAAKIPNPYIAVPIALLSHLVADIFPHWDSGTNGHKKTKHRLRIEATIDVLLGFAISYFIIFWLFPNTDMFYVFGMIIASQFFDWLTMPYYFFNIKFPFSELSYQIQKNFNTKLDKPWGIINQVLAIVFIIILAKLL